MNRLLTLILIGLAGLLASCGSTVTSSTQPANANYTYSMVVSPTLFTVNSGDWAPLSATVEVSFENQTPKALSPQPTYQVLLLGLTGDDLSRGISLRRTLGRRIRDLRPNQHASHRLRHHHGF